MKWRKRKDAITIDDEKKGESEDDYDSDAMIV